MPDVTVSADIDSFMAAPNNADARTRLGLGALATLSDAPAGGLTGTTLNSSVVNSSLTSVGTLGSLSVSGSTTLGMTVMTSTGFPPGESIRQTAGVNAVVATHSFTAHSTNGLPVGDGHGPSVGFAISGTGLARTTIARISCQRAGADNTGDMDLVTSNAGVDSTVIRLKSNNNVLIGSTTDASTGRLQVTGGIGIDKTITPAGTTGARTINKAAGSVNLAASATSLVVTNSLVTVNSVIMVTVTTSDTGAKSCSAVAAAGSFTIRPNSAPTGEVRVDFLVIN